MQNFTRENSAVKVKIYGKPNSPEAYAIRDFLKRSVVEYDWIEVTDSQYLANLLGIPIQDDAQLPVVELADGNRLFAPSITEIAHHLGWIAEPKLLEYDVSIYGAGPAGLSAAVYAASEGLKTILIEREAIGGQAGTSSLIENYMGFPAGISGAELAENARQQALKFGVEVLLLKEGVKAEFKNSRIYVNLADGKQLVAKANICATGVEYSKLELPREQEFLNRGVFYGAGASEALTCQDKHIFIIGGGNSAGQAAIYFAEVAAKVTLIVRASNLAVSLSDYLLKRIMESKNIEVLFHSQVVGLEGNQALHGIAVRNNQTGIIQKIATQRLFVCIGGKPNTEWAKDTAIIRDKSGYIITGGDLAVNGKLPECWKRNRNPYFLETSVPGSFAAGDVRQNSIKRVASAVGEGAMAVTFVHKYLEEEY